MSNKRENDIKKNFSYNIIYQILIILLPLITSPYISRTIGPEGLGIYSYTYSVAYYFALFAILGINNYGNRTIAKCRDNENELSKKFCSIYTLQLIASTIVMVLYIAYIILFDNQYSLYATIQLIYILSVALDINWFFFGLEKFKLTVTRNMIIKILSVCSIFIFVRKKEDLILYTIIMSMSNLISQIFLWIFIKKEIKFIKPSIEDVKKHIKPSLILFVPVIAVSLYKVMDKIMLKNMTNVINVGFYENAEKVIGIPMGVITALGTIMLPRISNLLENNEVEKVKKYIDKSIEFVSFLSIPIALGLIAVSKRFAPIFFGEEFRQTGIIIQYLATTVIFISWANVIRTQYLIPKEKDKIYIISVMSGAVINFIVNLILIPKYETIGAAIGTILAEFTVMLVQLVAVSKSINIVNYIRKFVTFAIKGIIMYILVYLCNYIDATDIIIVFLQVFVGIVTYSILNIRYIYISLNIKNLKEKILNKIKRKG